MTESYRQLAYHPGMCCQLVIASVYGDSVDAACSAEVWHFGCNPELAHIPCCVMLKETEGCQTDLHPVAKHIDRGYEWNEWEHRRKALAMVNLRQKRTHGSQTILSHFRRENATQVSHLNHHSNAKADSSALGCRHANHTWYTCTSSGTPDNLQKMLSRHSCSFTITLVLVPMDCDAM